MRKVAVLVGAVVLAAVWLAAPSDAGVPGPAYLQRPTVGGAGTQIVIGGFAADCPQGTASLEYPNGAVVKSVAFTTNNGGYTVALPNPVAPNGAFPVDLETVVRCGSTEIGRQPFTVTNNLVNDVNYPQRILTTPGAGREHVKGFAVGGGMRDLFFNLFANDYRGGASVAAGDIDDDGHPDAIVGSGPNAEESVVSVRSSIDNFINNFGAFGLFTGGVNVAAGDLNGDGKDDIVEAARAGGGPHVQVLTQTQPGFAKVTASFYAYEPSFAGGVSVAVGNVVGDAKNEIITGTGAGGAARIRVFTASGKFITEFLAFAPTFTGGVNVAAGDLVAGGVSLLDKDEIVVTPASGGAPVVRTFTGRGVRLGSFLAGAQTFRGGLSVAVGDADGIAGNEVVTGITHGGPPVVRTFTPDGHQLPGGAFYAYPDGTAGVNVAVMKAPIS